MMPICLRRNPARLVEILPAHPEIEASVEHVQGSHMEERNVCNSIVYPSANSMFWVNVSSSGGSPTMSAVTPPPIHRRQQQPA